MTKDQPLSATCAMYIAKQNFDSTVVAQLVKDGQDALAKLEPEKVQTAVAYGKNLSTAVDALSAAINKIPTKPLDTPLGTLWNLSVSIGEMQSDLSSLKNQLDDVHAAAQKSMGTEQQMQRQNASAAAALSGVAILPRFAGQHLPDNAPEGLPGCAE